MKTYVLPFEQITNRMVAQVGGKNASLGELFNALAAEGIRVPDGFAVTADGYAQFLADNRLEAPLRALLARLDTVGFGNLTEIGTAIRALFQQATLPPPLWLAIREAYQTLSGGGTEPLAVAVRSSATAEDLPTASFAGQHESFLNVRGEDELATACLNCYTSLFTDRAIKYRHDNGFDHLKVALSIGVQRMVRSDRAASGVCFTIDPDSGHPNFLLVTGSWGLGENVVLGRVNPDEFYVFKPFVGHHLNALISQQVGTKTQMLVYGTDAAGPAVVNQETPAELRTRYVLTADEVNLLARWAVAIETHYGMPMDIEWAKDGLDHELYIVQARPITVRPLSALQRTEYHLDTPGPVLARGAGIGHKIVAGTARLVRSPQDAPDDLGPGDVIVTDLTTPDWDPLLKKVSAIVTNRGGRTSHAAIVAREIGALAVVGTTTGTETIRDGSPITVACTDDQDGNVYEGTLAWTTQTIDLSHLEPTHTHTQFILSDPAQARRLSQYPNDGVGLLRLEFIINTVIGIHPMALARFEDLRDTALRAAIEARTRSCPNKAEFFVHELSHAVAMVAASFYPKPVIVRLSDFKTNEYANLLGGTRFEPVEENPMLGFRGAARYSDPRYAAGFGLECEALRRVRNGLGLTNLKIMVPFCRTVDEGRRVLDELARYGLVPHENNLEVYVMAEIPSNILLADEFAEIFDGFSIGSNDLTQLTLGIDRDSSTVPELFNENDPAVRQLIEVLLHKAQRLGKPVGICGQAPSDRPEFTEFLIEKGITSISFNPDAYLRGVELVRRAEDVLAVASL